MSRAPLTLEEIDEVIARVCGPAIPPSLGLGLVRLYLEGVDKGMTLVAESFCHTLADPAAADEPAGDAEQRNQRTAALMDQWNVGRLAPP